MFKKYKKKLEKLFKREEIGRKQLNFTCDFGIIERLKLLTRYLDTPFYPLAEHVLELGMSDIAATIRDSALIELLQRHLLREHLLVGELKPTDRHVSARARRISSALKFLELIESKTGSVEAVEQIIDRMLKEA